MTFSNCFLGSFFLIFEVWMQKTSIFELKFGFYIKIYPYNQFFRSKSLQPGQNIRKNNFSKLSKKNNPIFSPPVVEGLATGRPTGQQTEKTYCFKIFKFFQFCPRRAFLNFRGLDANNENFRTEIPILRKNSPRYVKFQVPKAPARSKYQEK